MVQPPHSGQGGVMTHQEAREIIDRSSAHIIVDEQDGSAAIDGEVTIEELQAILQLLEYSA
ncbi:MAG TPA: hypothetical protein VFM33_13875 [Aquabacterium sp.]|nr:hypothetical protein [Aquabacterium sp.]